MEKDFVETKLATKFANFNIRVYRDPLMKETLVLCTEQIDISQPVIVRVHSECLTGDMLGSLHCDCGQQLTKSLQIIREKGGVLIYLRQEGRGIGLFEKIRSYQLQSKGYDTFEANILLGHKPDLRSYEMVKTILDDLNIQKIKLLTNNPSKVSEIAKFGVEIVERLPLITKANKHNKKYLETKKQKFQHFPSNFNHLYFYQFHVDNLHQLIPVIEFLNMKKIDPLLRICVGIRADQFSLLNKDEIEKINSIINFCSIYPAFIPIIHFSFMDSTNIINTAKKIKETWPSACRIQLNDISKLDVRQLRQIFNFFQVDIPLSNDNFDILDSKQFRKLIMNNNSYILLDNSKGKGIAETKEDFQKKIDILLSHGLNNIGLCGGFGPDNLDIYFDLRRYYRINFSIDAETNLRSEGVYDSEKIKLYLQQLIRFDDPKPTGIIQTKKLQKECLELKDNKATINNIDFFIHPQVFHAGYFPSSSWLAQELCLHLKENTKFCEIGCGSGVISCYIALYHPKIHVVATDISPFATDNTKENAKNLGLMDRIQVFNGDVLDNICVDRLFDSIFWLLPFGYMDPGAKITLEEMQVFDPGYRSLRKLFKTASQFLEKKGKLFLGFSPSLGNESLLYELAEENSIKFNVLAEKEMKETEIIKFQLLRGIYE